MTLDKFKLGDVIYCDCAFCEKHPLSITISEYSSGGYIGYAGGTPDRSWREGHDSHELWIGLRTRDVVFIRFDHAHEEQCEIPL